MIEDKISAKDISKNLGFACPIEVLNSVDSTNKYLKKQICNTLIEGTTVIALSQTEGRGRFTRKFHSAEESGIYMSIFLRPCIDISEAPLITAAAAVAVCEAIEACSNKQTQIKWVNDILINSKKVCGILTEGVIDAENGDFSGVIVGIGINVYEPYSDFPEDIKNIAGAVFEERQEGLRSKIATLIIKNLIKYSKELNKKEFLDAYKNHSMVIGKQVTVISAEDKSLATAISIDDKCRLLVEYQDKSRKFLDSGEISIKL